MEIKNCPHCGCTASFGETVRNTDSGKEDMFVVICDNLFCMSGMSCSKEFHNEELINNWNKRV